MTALAPTTDDLDSLLLFWLKIVRRVRGGGGVEDNNKAWCALQNTYPGSHLPAVEVNGQVQVR